MSFKEPKKLPTGYINIKCKYAIRCGLCGECASDKSTSKDKSDIINVLKSKGWTFNATDGWTCPKCNLFNE